MLFNAIILLHCSLQNLILYYEYKRDMKVDWYVKIMHKLDALSFSSCDCLTDYGHENRLQSSYLRVPRSL